MKEKRFKLDPMSKRLLRRVARHILEEPRRFDMGDWAYDHPKSEGGPACNTTACIAGWSLLLKQEPKVRALTLGNSDLLEKLIFGSRSTSDPMRRGAEALGIPRRLAAGLFLSHCWEPPFDDAYRSARSYRAEAEVAVRYIDHICKNGLLDWSQAH